MKGCGDEDLNAELLHICFVGNMLGRNRGYVTTQGQIVADLFSADGAMVTCVSSRIGRAARFLEILRTVAGGRGKFDLVVLEVYSGLNFTVAETVSLICRHLKLPLIMFLHGGDLPGFCRRFPRLTAATLNRADALAAPSGFLSTEFGSAGFDVAVIPNVIELGNYAFRKRKRIKPKLLWMRSFHKIYNPELAVRVLESLRADFPDAVLTMAGVDKGLEERVRKLVEDLGLTDSVRFPGFLDTVAKKEEFGNADIFLNTNRIDNMPVSVVEAFAFGLPVVATDVGGIPYLIRNRENGLIVSDNDGEGMASCIKELLEDPVLTGKISSQARRTAERSAWEEVRSQWEDLILGTLEKCRAAAGGKRLAKDTGDSAESGSVT